MATAAPPPDDGTEELTRLLRAVGEGREELDAVVPLVYDELRRLAAVVRRGRAGETLTATALVHEAWMKLSSSRSLEAESRAHFFRIAARAMRQVLVDAAERKAAGKRGGGHLPVTLAEDMADDAPVDVDGIIDLDRALDALADEHDRPARVVELRIFTGLAHDQIAQALDVSVATVGRDWRFARAWLLDRLDRPRPR